MRDSSTEEEVTAESFKAACGRYATGVSVVTTADTDGAPEGLTVNSFTSVSLDPPLVLFCLERDAGSYGAFGRSQRFAVNVLDAAQAGLSTHFATRGVPDKFAGVAHRRDAEGLPLIDGALSQIVCRTVARHDGGDHIIIVGRVVRVALGPDDGRPLIYYRGRYGVPADDPAPSGG